MKISKLFHWLYCAVMFLPLFCLPIYALAVRSDNNYNPITLDVNEYKLVDFNQLNLDGTFQDGFDYYYKGGNVDYTFIDNYINLIPLDSNTIGNRWIKQKYNTNFVDGHKYFYNFNYTYPSSNPYFTYFRFYNTLNQLIYSKQIPPSSTITNFFDIYENNYDGNMSFQFVFDGVSPLMLSDIYFVDLTQAFGVGNEPSKEEFKSLYSSAYYDYTLSKYELLDLGTQTLTDTDFGSQTIYTLYKEVDDYFNYDNVLNIGELYEWCNINLFNGNSTLGFFIFFHLLEYWLLTSLLWLIFDILMYVPQLCHRWLDKPRY